MEFILELLLELIIEGSFDASTNKQMPKIIRCLLIAFIVLFFAVVILGLLFIGISLWDKNMWASLLIIAVSIVMLIASVYKFQKIYFKKRKESE